MNLLETVVEETQSYINNMPKSLRKKKGQFFTSLETAKFMASMIDTKDLEGCVSVLDPGSGTGILSAAILDMLDGLPSVSRISLTCYETDTDILPLLKTNLQNISIEMAKQFDYKIIEDDYILSQSNDFNETLLATQVAKKYDLVIGNPPYLRVLKDVPIAKALPKVVHGAPNLYFIFAAMSLFNLKSNGQMVYITPRSWTSGAYFKKFREYFLGNCSLKHIHLFTSRNKVFREESVLQETMIMKVDKGPHDKVLITSSSDSASFDDIRRIEMPYESIVMGENLYVYLPTNQKEVDVINMVNRYSSTFPDEGIRMRTGIVVEFRQYECLREQESDDVVPLFYAQHICDGHVNHQDSGKGLDWITKQNLGLIQQNKNYVFCKRFTAKEEKRRLQCGIYLANDFKKYEYIGTQNKINYIDNIDGSELEEEMVYGIYSLLNSTLFDVYYRILNGSTQVNSTEINNMPIPSRAIIFEIGKAAMKENDLSTATSDKIVMEIAYE